jgi:hypothetical protein
MHRQLCDRQDPTIRERGRLARRETEIRRLLAEIEADERALRHRNRRPILVCAPKKKMRGHFRPESTFHHFLAKFRRSLAISGPYIARSVVERFALLARVGAAATVSQFSGATAAFLNKTLIPLRRARTEVVSLERRSHRRSISLCRCSG